MMEYNSPYYSDKVNLEVAIGAIEFRDEVIKNLRQQIASLRELVLKHETIDSVEFIQYQHLRES